MAKPLPSIKTIELDEDGFPETVTIKLTLHQLAEVTRVLGKLAPATGSTAGTSAFYNCAVSELFNNYWEAGLDEYLPRG
jgi:hypothetical protein